MNTETLSNANTIHHTYGNCYQNIIPCSCKSIMNSSSSNSGNINLKKSSKRKRNSDKFTNVNKDVGAEVIESNLIFHFWQ